MATKGATPPVVDVRDQPDELDRLADRLLPSATRREVLGRMGAIFRSGAAPDPLPSGFLRGRLLATSTWGPWGSFVQRVAGVWMPWLGKSFDPSSGWGLNRFTSTAATRVWLKALFPMYAPDRVLPDRIDAFPFATRVAPAELDASVEVLTIDYDFPPNPALIRRILDELVQVAPGRYLGQVLMMIRGEYRPLGYFSLRTPGGEAGRTS